MLQITVTHPHTQSLPSESTASPVRINNMVVNKEVHQSRLTERMHKPQADMERGDASCVPRCTNTGLASGASSSQSLHTNCCLTGSHLATGCMCSHRAMKEAGWWVGGGGGGLCCVGKFMQPRKQLSILPMSENHPMLVGVDACRRRRSQPKRAGSCGPAPSIDSPFPVGRCWWKCQHVWRNDHTLPRVRPCKAMPCPSDFITSCERLRGCLVSRQRRPRPLPSAEMQSPSPAFGRTEVNRYIKARTLFFVTGKRPNHCSA